MTWQQLDSRDPQSATGVRLKIEDWNKVEVLTALQALQLRLHWTQPKMVMLRFGQVMRRDSISTNASKKPLYLDKAFTVYPPLSMMVTKSISFVSLGQFCIGLGLGFRVYELHCLELCHWQEHLENSN